jgi:LPXTG-motif cell wall-anchored protein
VSVDSQGNQANAPSRGSCISGDGRYIAFTSYATNLAPGAATWGNIFLHDRGTETVTIEAGAGETVTTDAGGVGATAEDPVETYITVPNAGTVSIDEGPVTATAPSGFQILAQQVNISAPAATVDDPLVIVFRLDSSQIPPGEDQNTIQIFKNGVQVASCTGPLGTASPDPCVSNRALLPDGDIEITVLTSTASAWNLGVAAGPSAPVGGVAELPQLEPAAASSGSGSSGPNALALAGIAAGGALLLAAGAWHARRRRRAG